MKIEKKVTMRKRANPTHGTASFRVLLMAYEGPLCHVTPGVEEIRLTVPL